MVDLGGWKLWIGVIAGTATLTGTAFGGGRKVIAIVDAPAVAAACVMQVDSLATEIAKLELDARLRICEMHGVFPSDCPAFGMENGR